MGILVDEVALGQVSVRLLQFLSDYFSFSANINRPMLPILPLLYLRRYSVSY